MAARSLIVIPTEAEALAIISLEGTVVHGRSSTFVEHSWSRSLNHTLRRSICNIPSRTVDTVKARTLLQALGNRGTSHHLHHVMSHLQREPVVLLCYASILLCFLCSEVGLLDQSFSLWKCADRAWGGIKVQGRQSSADSVLIAALGAPALLPEVSHWIFAQMIGIGVETLLPWPLMLRWTALLTPSFIERPQNHLFNRLPQRSLAVSNNTHTENGHQDYHYSLNSENHAPKVAVPSQDMLCSSSNHVIQCQPLAVRVFSSTKESRKDTYILVSAVDLCQSACSSSQAIPCSQPLHQVRWEPLTQTIPLTISGTCDRNSNKASHRHFKIPIIVIIAK